MFVLAVTTFSSGNCDLKNQFYYYSHVYSPISVHTAGTCIYVYFLQIGADKVSFFFLYSNAPS